MPPVIYHRMGIFVFFNKDKKDTLDKGLEKTKTSVFDKLARAVAGKSKVDDDVLDNLEEVLITSDVGVDTTLKIIERIEERVARDKYVSTSELNAILRDEIAALLAENNTEDQDNWDLPSDHKITQGRFTSLVTSSLSRSSIASRNCGSLAISAIPL